MLARIAGLREQLAQLASFQSAELQRLAVMNVLHETVEATLVDQFIRSPDRRWFCEGVANFVAFKTLEVLLGTEVAKSYYDVDAEVAKYAALKGKVDLEHWPVVEDPRSKEVPADVNLASYAFATKRVFEGFAEEGRLAKVLTEGAKAGRDKVTIHSVLVVYEKETGRKL